MTITINGKTIDLEVGEHLTMRELRKIFPIIQSKRDWWEIEMVVDVVKCLSADPNVEETINSMTVDEFNELSIKVSALLDTKKKTN